MKEDGDGYSIDDWSGIGSLYYNLWDRIKMMGCKCDSLYYGPDCSLRKCVLGVDPLYRGTPLYEEAYVLIVGSDDDLKGTFDLVFYDNLGSKYILDGLKYGNVTYDKSNETSAATCEEIMAYFPNNRIQDTKVGTTTYPFCTRFDVNEAMPERFLDNHPVLLDYLPNGMYGVLYWFNYKKGNPGYHKDLYVKAIHRAPEVTSTQNIAFHWVQQQGMDCDYQDIGRYDVTLPGYILNGVEGEDHFTFSEDLQFWLRGTYFLTDMPANTNSTIVMKTNWIEIVLDPINADPNNSTYYEIASIERVPLFQNSPTGTIISYGSKIYLEDRVLQINAVIGNGTSNIVDTHMERSLKIPIKARLTPMYQYVSHCSNRGTCNHDTGLCECFAGYKTTTCDTQAPQC
jgi:hypothetical protein